MLMTQIKKNLLKGCKLYFNKKRINLISYESIREKVDALIKGFYSLLPINVLQIYSPYEFDFLLSGQSEVDLKDWRNNTIYKGIYSDKHPVSSKLI